MNVLVVNIGSTSFKFRVLDMADERVIARGGVEGISKPVSKVSIQIGAGRPTVTEQQVADQPGAVQLCLRELAASGAPAAVHIDAVGFKAVHGGLLPEAVPVTEEVIDAMEELSDAVPAHNPPYVAAMRAFKKDLPGVPLVAAFETGFHHTIPASRTTYAIPWDWTTRYGVRRYGFHGASHRYVATRTAELLGRDNLRIISCHLGGSSSVCAIRDGQSVATSFGMTPQTGLPQNNRVGEFDPYALPLLAARTGKNTNQLLAEMSIRGGLLGISGVSNDMEQIIAATRSGSDRAELAVEVYTEAVRDCIGAYLVALGGLDVLVFTGGIGERSPEIRERVCRGLEFLGIALDPARNPAPPVDAKLSTDDSKVVVLAMETNEELIVARQTERVLEGQA